jgi:hypothetical protein
MPYVYVENYKFHTVEFLRMMIANADNVKAIQETLRESLSDFIGEHSQEGGESSSTCIGK